MAPLMLLAALAVSMLYASVEGQLKTDTAKPKVERPPKIQLRAILVRCPYRSRFKTYKDTGEQPDVAMTRSKEVLQFYGYDRDEPLLHSEVIKCRRKLVITVKLSICGKMKTDSEYVVVDHVYDPVSKQKGRLLNPIVLKITQQEILQAYPLFVERVINAEASEEVVSKDTTPFYTGCDVSSNKPTCGRAYYGGKTIPFSEGFCCSCDLFENVKRQPVVLRGDSPETDVAFSTHTGQFAQRLNAHLNVSAQKFQRNVDKELLNLSKEFEKSEEKTKAQGFLSFLENRNTTYVDVNRLKRYYPKFPKAYYNFPPMEPAKGFRREDFSKKEGMDPWEPAPPISYYWKEYYNYKKTSVNPFIHVLSKRKAPETSTPLWQKSKEEVSSNSILGHSIQSQFNGSLALKNDVEITNEAVENDRQTNMHKRNGRQAKMYNSKKDASLFNNQNIKSNAHKYQNPTNNRLSAFSNNKPFRGQRKDTDLLANLGEITQCLQEANARMKRSLNEISKGISNIKNSADEDTTGTLLDLKNNVEDTNNYTQSVNSNKLKKRQTTAGGHQRRGGQDCIDRFAPPFVNPVTYHESAHCLRFSDLWYTAYKVKEPFIAHTVEFEMYEKHCLEGLRNKWEIITKGFKAEVGTFVRRVMDRGTTVVFSYTPYTVMDRTHFCIPAGRILLLVPRAVPLEKIDEFPQATEPSGKYLVIHPSDVTYDGEDCDKIGISYSGFFKQPDRCSQPKGTCLKNQPLHLWRSDMARRARGEKGLYFLENYASVPDNAIKLVEGTEFLTLDYDGQYESIVEIEVKADGNAILRKESTVQISEMYVDSTCEYHTKITISVTNNGLVSSLFRPRMTNCPVSIPTVWYQQEGPLVAIAPQRKHTYRLSLYGITPASRFHCSIEILNRDRKIMAVRRVRIQKFDRCVCMWHCLCACTGSLRSLECVPMSIEHYHAAGFIGSMPIITNEQTTDDSNYRFYLALGQLLPTAVCIHVFLLLFGLCKAVIGLCCSKTIAILHLHLVCPSLVRHLGNADPVLAANIKFVEDHPVYRRNCKLKVIEFFYNLVCFLVVPGWCFLYCILDIIRRCVKFISPERKKSRKKKMLKRTTRNIYNE